MDMCPLFYVQLTSKESTFSFVVSGSFPIPEYFLIYIIIPIDNNTLEYYNIDTVKETERILSFSGLTKKEIDKC